MMTEQDDKDKKTNNHPILLGNIYGDKIGTGMAGNVWSIEGVCNTLMTMQGGNRQPMIVVLTK